MYTICLPHELTKAKHEFTLILWLWHLFQQLTLGESGQHLICFIDKYISMPNMSVLSARRWVAVSDTILLVTVTGQFLPIMVVTVPNGSFPLFTNSFFPSILPSFATLQGDGVFYWKVGSPCSTSICINVVVWGWFLIFMGYICETSSYGGYVQGTYIS